MVVLMRIASFGLYYFDRFEPSQTHVLNHSVFVSFLAHCLAQIFILISWVLEHKIQGIHTFYANIYACIFLTFK